MEKHKGFFAALTMLFGLIVIVVALSVVSLIYLIGWFSLFNG